MSGSVHILEDAIRVYVELDDTYTHTNVWTHTFDKKMSVSSIIAIQDDIAHQAAAAIAQPYGVIIRNELANLNRKSTNDLTAYELYLHYYKWRLTLSPKDHLLARESLEQAVQLDQDFSDAWAALAMIYAAEHFLSCNIVKRDREIQQLTFETARKACQNQPRKCSRALRFILCRPHDPWGTIKYSASRKSL